MNYAELQHGDALDVAAALDSDEQPDQMALTMALANALRRIHATRTPLTRQQIDAVMTEHYPLDSLLRENVDAFEACVRDIERMHGIGA